MRFSCSLPTIHLHVTPKHAHACQFRTCTRSLLRLANCHGYEYRVKNADDLSSGYEHRYVV